MILCNSLNLLFSVSKNDTIEKSIADIKGFIEEIVPKEKYSVQLEAMDSKSNPFIITQPEFMRRMKEMQQTGGGGGGGGGGGKQQPVFIV